MSGNPNARVSRRGVQFMLRLPEGLRDRVRSHAVSQARSVNSEIVIALEEKYPAPLHPETVNEALVSASSALLDDWSKMLHALGQSATENPRYTALADAIAAAAKKGGAK